MAAVGFHTTMAHGSMRDISSVNPPHSSMRYNILDIPGTGGVYRHEI